MQSFMELLLPVSVSRKVSLSIARQFEELALIDFHGLAALDKVAELSFLSGHNCLRNVAGTESNLEFFPGDDSSWWQSLPVCGPPLSCGTLQEVSCKRDIAVWRNSSWFHLEEDVTQPIIGIKGIG